MDITTIIKARTKNQLLTITERPLIASGDANTVLVYFAFDPAWDAFTIKYACFHKANTPHIVYKMLISDDGYATVPHEVLDDAGDIFFGVKGYIPDHPEVIKTSLNVKYNILVGTNPSSSAPPTPDEFEQMMSEVGRIKQEFSEEATEIKQEFSEEVAEIKQEFSEEVAKIGAELMEAEANSAAQFAKQAQSISKNDKRITNLEQGLMADAFESDSSVAYTKTVPADALPFAEVQEVGGMSYAENGEIRNAAVTAVESEGAKHTLPIPAEVQALDGWGMGTDYKNYNRLILETKEYRKEVASIDLGALTWTAQANNVFNGSFALIAPPASYPERTRGVLTADYANSTSQSTASMPDKSILRFDWGVAIRDTAYTDAAAFKAAVSGKTLLYAMKTPTVINLVGILPEDNFIEVEGGGTVTAVNEHRLAAPTEIIYQMKGVTA